MGKFIHWITHNRYRSINITSRNKKVHVQIPLKISHETPPLNTKRAKKGYYKGKDAPFIADPLKKLQLIVPDLTGFKLKPYIAKTISKIPPEYRIGNMPGP
ncbi:hypothetical protein ACHAWO_012485 [Cyclotella atomus]|uniref:Uncharacterized protein n=1 Tax=Cyclotella atomus TaxID=382360 RepID=A0ABD3NFG6_9STRA